MNEKKRARIRRATRARSKISELGAYRLTVSRTPRHTYAQVISPEDGRVVATASTVQEAIRTSVKNTGNSDAAAAVGKLIAERTKEAGITEIAFDRSGYKYHGRIKALAEAARENGLKF